MEDGHRLDQQSRTKRGRKRVSCVQCRNRKIKCGREVPSCRRCERSRFPTRCLYGTPPLSEQPGIVIHRAGHISAATDESHPKEAGLRPASNTPLAATLRSKSPIDFLSSCPPAQIGLIDSSVTILDKHSERTADMRYGETPACSGANRQDSFPRSMPTPQQSQLASASKVLNLKNEFMLRGKGDHTRYFGGGIVANLKAQVPEFVASHSMSLLIIVTLIAI